MEENRITKLVFKWDLKCENSWSSQIRALLYEINMQDIFTSMSTISPQFTWAMLHEQSCEKWFTTINNKPKLRTYVTFKERYEVEKYALSLMSRETTIYFSTTQKWNFAYRNRNRKMEWY